MVENRCSVQREGVYRWFSGLNSAQRAEFLCGLLDLCVPIELRFLGSCLEDLARKDYHSLRDAEIKANNPADLSNLTNITDEVVRSKLLISLALLSSDNREAAGVLFRTLTHIDSIINNYGLQLNDGQTEEQFLLLFTMASNHPAFSFHQKQVLRQELTQIQEIMQVPCGEQQPVTGGCGGTGALATLSSATSIPTYISAPTHSSRQAGCPCCHKTMHQEIRAGQGNAGMPSISYQELPVKVHVGNPSKVNIERVELRGVTYDGEKPHEYILEVTWSDSSVSTVSRTHQEVLDFFSQVSRLFPDESLEKFLPQSSGFDQTPELDPRCLTTLPSHILKHYQARLFFNTAPIATTLSPPPSASLGCLLQYRGANRAVCGVASVQPVMSVHNSIQPRSPTQLPPLPPQGTVPILPPGGVGVVGGENSSPLPGHLQNPGPPQQSSPEQNGILDWLRKLRLHKYYPVFKQLTMEEFLGLTEEDLNKYDLTQGAKKKLKTQLELQNREKMEKRFMLSQFPVSCSGIARVSPSSHIGPVAHAHSSCNTELRVEVETSVPPLPRDSSFSSGYSSAPSSPMTPHSLSVSREGAFDRTKEPHRRMESVSGLDPGEKDRACVLLNTAVTTGPSRPTAQVLPVQNDPTSCLSHMSVLPPSLPLLSTGRILSPARKPRPPPLCPDERSRPLGSGVSVGLRLENMFPGLSVDSVGSPSLLQDSVGHRGTAGVTLLRSPPVLMVETSTALTSTSNTLHHVSHPPLHLQVSPSRPRAVHYPYPSSSSSLSPSSKSAFPSGSGIPMGTASSVPMAAVPGQTYCLNSSGAVRASSSPSSTETSCYSAATGPAPSSSGSAPIASGSASNSSGSAQISSACVCSSCGCSGNCGSYGALPASYAGYFQHPLSGTSVFTLGPLLHLSPLLAGSSTASPFPYPLVAPPPYNSSVSLSHDTPGQQGLVLPPMQGFLGAGTNVYQPHGLLGDGVHRKPGSLSCYNCGVAGHRAQECKQPPMDAAQQGTFRLKYAPKSDSQDSGD
ncbi:zinc finger CCHC domain-containing protein 14 isoform X1 [Esox lucius]|uniref:zinc finger CCHC domain-containing protein 14 isoform X1 n=1 Tax=Esox lucius TaxID=8010 RepID=UPI0014770AB5|nr:zinc finger CCHC domain-containing protein 14 isoform X1 [Esox lucius]